MTVTRFNVQRASWPALYLSYNSDLGELFWTTDPDRNRPHEYDDRDEAESAALENGGEVFEFTRPMLRTDSESFTGHNAESRLQHHFREAAE